MIPPALIEAVARAVFREMEMDPDEEVPLSNFRFGPAWQAIYDDAHKAIAFARAVKLCDTEPTS